MSSAPKRSAAAFIESAMPWTMPSWPPSTLTTSRPTTGCAGLVPSGTATRPTPESALTTGSAAPPGVNDRAIDDSCGLTPAAVIVRSQST
ncbi:hypothetical protein [Lentzea sp. E54]|uniref:hypothetical protein n=1 Tax=Lentzea xerophila TaxID=3435883 RepID=UPI003DA21CCE